MHDFIPHCTNCDHPLGPPACDAEREALMRAVCDTLALLNVTAPINTPGVGGPLVPPGPTPFAPQAGRYRLKYGVMECVTCGLAKEYCPGHSAPDAQSQDAKRADASLEQRVKDCKGR